MGDNYNFKINPKLPSSEDIAKHQDFAALLQQFEESQSTPLLRRKSAIVRRMRYVGAWAAAAAVALLLVFMGTNTNKSIEVYQKEQATYFAALPYVNPPLPKAQPQLANFKVQANQGGIYEYESGSKLIIPAEAFLNDRGKLVEGDVDIKYREYHDFVDFFLSGIPMVYDSAGVLYNLESAGMMEIYAEQNGKRVKMAPGKSIDVELVSAVQTPHLNVPPGYNIYKLDQEKRHWVYQDIDRMQFLEDGFKNLKKDDPLYEAKRTYQDELSLILKEEQSELNRIESSIPLPEKPLKPQRRNGDMPSLELDFLDDLSNPNEDDQSLAIRKKYDGKIWQLSPESPAFNENAAKITWEDFRLKQLNDRDFELTLINGKNELHLLINPVLTGAEYDLAISNYTNKMAEYEQLFEERKEQLAGKKKALVAKITAAKAKALQSLEEKIKDYEAKNHFLSANEIPKRKIVNRFKATSFGIWNCDKPVAPELYHLNATFVDKSGKKYSKHTAYLVDKNRNTIDRFYATEDTKLRFNSTSDNLLWLLTEDNKIAIFRPKDFKRINKKKGDYTFELEVVDTRVENEEDVRKILSF